MAFFFIQLKLDDIETGVSRLFSNIPLPCVEGVRDGRLNIIEFPILISDSGIWIIKIFKNIKKVEIGLFL